MKCTFEAKATKPSHIMGTDHEGFIRVTLVRDTMEQAYDTALHHAKQWAELAGYPDESVKIALSSLED